MGCTDGLCRPTYRLQGIQIVSDLLLCVLQSFCLCLKTISCRLPLPPALTGDWTSKYMGKPFLVDNVSKQKKMYKSLIPRDVNLGVSAFSTLLIYVMAKQMDNNSKFTVIIMCDLLLSTLLLQS